MKLKSTQQFQLGMVAILTCMCASQVYASPILIDNFSVRQEIGTTGPDDIAVGKDSPMILGGQRDVELVVNSTATNTSSISGGKLSWSFRQNTSSSSFINDFVSYDGVDFNFQRFPQFDPGLSVGGSGFDFTDGGTNNKFKLDMGTLSENMFGDMKIWVQVRDADGDYGSASKIITAAESDTSVVIHFFEFANIDFQNIRNVMFYFNGSASAGQEAYAEVDRFRAVPEPASALLLGCGLLCAARRRR